MSWRLHLCPRMYEQLHDELTRLNEARFTPALPTGDAGDELATEIELRRKELAFLEHERAGVAARARGAPRDPHAFVAWFEDLAHTGPGQGDGLFPYLAEEATLAELKWFLRQEVAGEAGFDDLVALAQLKISERAKLEMARNYWDELGRGSARGMHGPMLARLDRELGLDHSIPVVWEAVALNNVMAGLAANRRYAYHAIGALGVVELTAPGRSALTNEGLRRCGVDARTRQYYALHATLDLKHSEAWNREVLVPLVSEDGARATAIAEGALMRLAAGARCFERYRQELGCR